MISHILFPRLTDENVPATMSRRIITGLLREKLGFGGLILTDCMEMDAVKKYYGTPEGVVASVKAGVDLAEISSTVPLMRDAARALLEAGERGELDIEEITSSVERILYWKDRIDMPTDGIEAGLPEDFEAAGRMSAAALTLCQGEIPELGGDTFFCGCADYRVNNAANESGGEVPFPKYMASEFGGACLVTPKEPGDEEIASAAAAASKHGRIVLGTCNAHLFRGQQRLAEALYKTGKPLTVVVLRNPYDVPLLPRCECVLASYDYSNDSLKAIAGAFRGAPVTGKCPVRL